MPPDGPAVLLSGPELLNKRGPIPGWSRDNSVEGFFVGTSPRVDELVCISHPRPRSHRPLIGARSNMDITVWRDLSGWLATHWPFTNPDYTPRQPTKGSERPAPLVIRVLWLSLWTSLQPKPGRRPTR